MTAEGVAAILVGIGAVISPLILAWVSIVNSKRIRDIDHAVNGRPKGSVTMQSQVADLHEERPAPKGAVNGAAIREMVAMLVEDMHHRHEKEE